MVCTNVLRGTRALRSLDLSRHSGFVIPSSFVLRASSFFHCTDQEQEHGQEQDYELSKSPQAFDTNASTTMSDCDECGGKMGWIEIAGAATSGTVSPVHHWFAHFRQRHVDAND